MSLLNNSLPLFGGFSQGFCLQDGGYLIAVHDVVNPAAQGVNGMDRFSFVRAEGTER